ncbi:Uncharacterised protein [Escherichia coli]|nr:Uncharacterised protein [Escherichia coli]
MSEINSQALREAAEKAGEDKWQAKKINGDFFVIRHGSYTRQHGYTSYQPIAEIDCKPVRDLLPRLIRLPCWNYWMNWKQQKSALQNWKRGKYCSRNVAACFIEQIFTMITKR